MVTGEVSDTDLIAYQYRAFSYKFTVTDGDDGSAVSFSGATIKFTVYEPKTESVLFQLTSTAGQITVASNVVTVTGTGANTATAGGYRYVLGNATADTVIARGRLNIVEMADHT